MALCFRSTATGLLLLYHVIEISDPKTKLLLDYLKGINRLLTWYESVDVDQCWKDYAVMKSMGGWPSAVFMPHTFLGDILSSVE